MQQSFILVWGAIRFVCKKCTESLKVKSSYPLQRQRPYPTYPKMQIILLPNRLLLLFFSPQFLIHPLIMQMLHRTVHPQCVLVFAGWRYLWFLPPHLSQLHQQKRRPQIFWLQLQYQQLFIRSQDLFHLSSLSHFQIARQHRLNCLMHSNWICFMRILLLH